MAKLGKTLSNIRVKAAEPAAEQQEVEKKPKEELKFSTKYLEARSRLAQKSSAVEPESLITFQDEIQRVMTGAKEEQTAQLEEFVVKVGADMAIVMSRMVARGVKLPGEVKPEFVVDNDGDFTDLLYKVTEKLEQKLFESAQLDDGYKQELVDSVVGLQNSLVDMAQTVEIEVLRNELLPRFRALLTRVLGLGVKVV